MFQRARKALPVALMASSLLAFSPPQGHDLANALSFKDMQGMTYMQMKGTGLANTCPTIEVEGASPTSIKAGAYDIKKMCFEPNAFEVKNDNKKGPEYVNTDVVTRLTYTLSEIEGSMKVGSDGSIEFKEKEGMDFQPVTLQLPGGSRVPFLFTVKALNATGNVSEFSGPYDVPSYRGSSFLDPKMRGATLGYDNAAALITQADSEELEKENLKTTATLQGNAKLSIVKYDPETGEVAGTFESVQPSDTDLGAKAPKDVRVTGNWYAQL